MKAFQITKHLEVEQIESNAKILDFLFTLIIVVF